MSLGGEVRRKILQVELDAADARMIPVADEGDLHWLVNVREVAKRLTTEDTEELVVRVSEKRKS